MKCPHCGGDGRVYEFAGKPPRYQPVGICVHCNGSGQALVSIVLDGESPVSESNPRYDFPAHTRHRKRDPDTSKAAAHSLGDLREAQRAVLDAFAQHGPMTHEQLVARVSMSRSGARTRCSELVELGRVEDSGQRRKLASGRLAIVWRLTV